MAQGLWGPGENSRVFRVNLLFTREGQKCQTGFHLRDVGLTNQDESDVIDAVWPWASVQFVKFLRTTDSLLGVDVTNLVTRTGASSTQAAIAGTVNDAPAPPFLNVPVTIKGSIRRRYGNGRMFWPVPGNGFINGSVLHPTFKAWYDTAITELGSMFMGSTLTQDLHLVHLHDALPGVGARLPVPASWYDATSIRLNSTLGSLSRRKVGHGV
jgi:hypothetical protein